MSLCCAVCQNKTNCNLWSMFFHLYSSLSVFGWEKIRPWRMKVYHGLSTENRTHYCEETGMKSEVVQMDSQLSVESCRSCWSLSLTCKQCACEIWSLKAALFSVFVLCFSHVNNDALYKIYTVVFSVSIRWGCFGCVMKINGDVAVPPRPHAASSIPIWRSIHHRGERMQSSAPSLQLHLHTGLRFLTVFNSIDLRTLY